MLKNSRSESKLPHYRSFADLLVRALNPQLIVELGTKGGFSDFAFCRAVAEAGLSNKCYAVGALRKNANSRVKGRKTCQPVQAENFQYDKFSKLQCKTFLEARQDFQDGSIDLLHFASDECDENIDDLFEGWRCKLSDRAIVLFHNTEECVESCGVSLFWRELSKTRPSINLDYQNGLGVLFWGPNCGEVKATLVDMIAQTKAQQVVFDPIESKYDTFAETVSEHELTGASQSKALFKVEQLSRDLSRLNIEGDRTFDAYLKVRSELERITTDLERLRIERNKSHAEAEELRAEAQEFLVEAEELRRVVTRLLQSPLVALGENVRYKAARKIARVISPISPSIGKKLNRSASKRAPKRFMDAPKPKKLFADFDISRPTATANARKGEPVVILPFKNRLIATRTEQKIAVILHAYHVDQAKIFRDYLSNIPTVFSLFISTNTEEKADELRNFFTNGPAQSTEVKVMPNRGRDVAPKLVGFGDVHANFDLVLHIHTKSSSHNDDLKGWRNYVLDALVGSQEVVDSILDAFSCSPRLGMVAPPNFPAIRPHMHWGSNFGHARDLARHMGIALTPDAPLDFPSGSMFWARSEALAPLLNIGLTTDDFPDELGQLDGTIAHAIERLYFYSCEASGLRWIHAGSLESISSLDEPIRVGSSSDLDCVLTDQMPALLLPGTQPNPASVTTALSEEHDYSYVAFQNQCVDDLEEFFSAGTKLTFAKSENPKLSIVIALRSKAELTFQCLRALHCDMQHEIEIILAGNRKLAGIGSLLERIDGVSVIENDKNETEREVISRAAQEARGEYLLLLSDGLRVLPGTISAAISILENEPDIGAVGGPVKLMNGRLKEAGGILSHDGNCLAFGQGQDAGDAKFQFRRDVDYCSDEFVLLRTKFWTELGGVDGSSDAGCSALVVLSQRIWEMGYRIVYDPLVKVVSFEPATMALNTPERVSHAYAEIDFIEEQSRALTINSTVTTKPHVTIKPRTTGARRLLIIDDRIPQSKFRFSESRTIQLTNVIDQAGWSSTLYPTLDPYLYCEQMYQVIPRTVELIKRQRQSTLEEFLTSRAGLFDAVLVHQPHNLEFFRQAISQLPEFISNTSILYDAGATFPSRDDPKEYKKVGTEHFMSGDIDKELGFARDAEVVFSASERNAKMFQNYGCKDTRVLRHSFDLNPSRDRPEGRQNILFVGDFNDGHSADMDALFWFVDKVLPHVDAQVGSDWLLKVAGNASVGIHRAFSSDRVKFLGPIEDWRTHYQEARMFVAPSQNSAANAEKVFEAASVGVPIVTTSFTGDQIGWKDGVELLTADDPVGYARACAVLFKDNSVWRSLRKSALRRIETDFNAFGFQDTILSALETILEARH